MWLCSGCSILPLIIPRTHAIGYATSLPFDMSSYHSKLTWRKAKDLWRYRYRLFYQHIAANAFETDSYHYAVA